MPEPLIHSPEKQESDGVTRLRRVAIVPALNEADSIGTVIQEIRQTDSGFEIVVVDDGSTDGTKRIAREAGATVLTLPYNLGIGAAVQTGYQYARSHGFDVAVQVDGDGQHDPRQLHMILQPLLAGEADVVIGSRFTGAGDYRPDFSRLLGIRLFAAVVTIVLGQRLTDTSSSFRAVNRRAICLFAADYPHGFIETVEATVVAVRHGLRVKEVSVSMRERSGGRSTLTLPRAIYYSLSVLVAVFVGGFRRPRTHLQEEQ